jgi:hypothetical protein
MRNAFVALACAGIALLPMRSLAESGSGLTGSDSTIRSGNTGALTNDINGRTASKIATTGEADRTASGPELNAAVKAQDKVLQQKLKSICRGC